MSWRAQTAERKLFHTKSTELHDGKRANQEPPRSAEGVNASQPAETDDTMTKQDCLKERISRTAVIDSARKTVVSK